jgi:alpha-tubulin suppressor-like RCC1 family protein
MWLWGGNTYGQIGNGTCAIRSMPVRASRFTGTALFAEGLYYTIAARSDGSVWGWGNDKNGSLGNGRTANSSVPVQVIGLTDVVEVSAGGGQSLALKSDGTVWAWGYNGNGQLGNGTRLDSSFPIQVKGLVGVIAVSAGYTHSLALKSDGTVWAWGNNSFSELGPAVSSAERYRSLPVRVEGLTNVVSIAAGQHYSAALKSDGTVWSWGYNGEGRLGNGTQVESSIPVRAAGLTGVTAISVGLEHSLALKNDATVWAWGANRAGKLGNGSYTDSAVPLQVGGLTGVVAVAAGAYHSVALKNDRSVWSWGQASHGELGVERDSHCLVPIYSFSLETNPPTITLRREIEGTEYTDDLWKSASSVTVDASASNDADEVNAGTWKYRVDGGAWTAEGSENDSVTITAEGDHTVVFSVADNLGNYAVKAASVKIDRTPPVIAVDAKLGVTEAGAAWTNAAPLSLTATDLSGIASFTCTAAKKRADGSYASTSAVSLTGTALVFAEEGIYRLALAAVDLAGHTTSRTQYARLDVNPPTLTVAVNGAVTASAGKSTIPLLITNATDAVTGIRTWKYALDGSTTYKWLGPTQIAGTDDWNASITIAALTLGSHTITVRCTDNAGNARDETATFTVTAP